MDKKIIRIEPVEKVFSITWIMNLRCNNDCMYCGVRHDNHSELPSLERLQTHWTKVFEKSKHLNLRYKIALSGGEVTINKNFLPFMQWLNENYKQHLHHVGITTNGRASKKYYLKLFEQLNFISFSTHTESLDIETFFDTALALHKYASLVKNKFFMINIMEEYWAEEKIKQIIDFCHENKIFYSVGRIDYQREGSRKYPIFRLKNTTQERQDLEYSDEANEKTHRSIQEYINTFQLPVEHYNNIIVHYEDGTNIRTYATRLKFLGLDKFHNWNCNAGIARISINPNGDVYSAECNNDFIGNLDNNTFELYTQARPCKFATCTNNPDNLMVDKRSPDYENYIFNRQLTEVDN